MGIYVLVEGARRLFEPTTVDAVGMAVFAAIGLIGNVIGMAFLFRSRSASLNLRGAFLEVATDGHICRRPGSSCDHRSDGLDPCRRADLSGHGGW
jgi:hypothetical protein